MTVRARQNIPLTETWSRSSWANWDIETPFTTGTDLGRQPGVVYSASISGQQHINLRTFNEPQGWSISGAGTITAHGYLPAFNHWPGMTVSLTPGLATLTSNYTQPIDLTTVSDGTLTIALPNFPGGGVDLANSYIELSSLAGPVCTLPWSIAMTQDLSILYPADVLYPSDTLEPISTSESLAWTPDALAGSDLTQITGVRLLIATTANCVVNLMAMRLIGDSWVQTNVDFDSLSGALGQCIPLTGDPGDAPVANNQTLPIMWRSAEVSGDDDPRPINSEIGFLFNTGSQTRNNSFSLYMREHSEAFLTQIDLEGSPQASLTGKPQPTEGVSLLAPRTMGDMDVLSMQTADAQTVGNLEAVSDPVFTSWMRFTVSWGPAPSLQITNSVNPADGYKYTGQVYANNTTYLAICNLTETAARLQIYGVDQTTLALGALLYDSTLIPDGFLFPRRAGRIGFQSSLQDGDSYVGAIRPRGLMFAEYRSAPLRSLTPVQGARLYVQSSPPLELFTGWSALADSGGNAPDLAPDQQRYVKQHPDGRSTRVTVTTPNATPPVQGVISNLLSPSGDLVSGITDFEQFHVEFSLWVPSTVLVNGQCITAALVSDSGAKLPLNIPPLRGDKWETISLLHPFPEPHPQSGLYQFALYYSGTTGTTFWVDGVTVHEHMMTWDGRSIVDDPWHSNYAPWTTFHDTINSDTNGVFFTTMGAELQVRGQAHKQDAIVFSSPKLVPQYASLGRFVWPEDTPPSTRVPVAVINTTHVSGRTYQFDGTSSSGANIVGDYQWAFGDGSVGSGPVVQYTYPAWVPGGTDYNVILTVIDRAGQPGIVSTLITL